MVTKIKLTLLAWLILATTSTWVIAANPPAPKAPTARPALKGKAALKSTTKGYHKPKHQGMPKAQAQGFTVPLWRKFSFLPQRWLETLQGKLESQKTNRLKNWTETKELSDKCNKFIEENGTEGEIQKKIDEETKNIGLENLKTDKDQKKIEDLQKTLNNLTELKAKVIRLKALRLQKGLKKFNTHPLRKEHVIFNHEAFDQGALPFAASMSKALGAGMYGVELLSDQITNHPIYKILELKGIMPNPSIFKNILRCLMAVDPILTKGWVYRVLETLLRLSLLSRAPELLTSHVAEMLNPDYVGLGDIKSFFSAHRIDSLAAIPAIIELMTLRFTASAATTLLLKKQNGRLEDLSLDKALEGIQHPINHFKDNDGKFILANKTFWKEDLLTLAKYGRVLAMQVVANRYFNMNNPAVFEKLYKYSLGLLEPRTISFLSSAAAIKLLEQVTPGLKKTGIVNFKQADSKLIVNHLVRDGLQECFFDHPDGLEEQIQHYLDSKQKTFKTRKITAILTRFTLHTLIERGLTVLLDKLQRPVARILDNTLEINMLLFRLLKLQNPTLTRMQLKQRFFKPYGPPNKRQKRFELNLQEEFAQFPIPAKIIIDKAGPKLLLKQTIDGKTGWRRLSDYQLFGGLADMTGQTTMILKNERGKFFSKLLAQSLTSGLVAPMVENLLVAASQSQWAKDLAKNNFNGHVIKDDNIKNWINKRNIQAPGLGNIAWFTIISTLWLAHGFGKNWIKQGLKQPKPKHAGLDTRLFHA